MKTSATDTQQIDRYLLQQMPPPDKLVFDARLILSPDLQEATEWQAKVQQLVMLRGRKALKQEIKSVEHKLFGQAEYSVFKRAIMRLFGR